MLFRQSRLSNSDGIDIFSHSEGKEICEIAEIEKAASKI